MLSARIYTYIIYIRMNIFLKHYNFVLHDMFDYSTVSFMYVYIYM